jgi:hypothetical protein
MASPSRTRRAEAGGWGAGRRSGLGSGPSGSGSGGSRGTRGLDGGRSERSGRTTASPLTVGSDDLATAERPPYPQNSSPCALGGGSSSPNLRRTARLWK